MNEEEDIVIVAADWRGPVRWLMVAYLLMALCSFMAGLLR